MLSTEFTEQQRRELTQRWQQAIEDKSLQDLPYKMEQDKWGHIVMSPASNQHAFFQAKIAGLLSKAMSGGEVLTECSVSTPEGVKVPDVVWCSAQFFKKYGLITPYPVAPEICVEVLSPSNSRQEMAEKTKLYFAQGALEVWMVNSAGKIEFYTQQGQQQQSAIVKSANGLPSFL